MSKIEFNSNYTTSCDCSCDEQTKQDEIFAVTKILESHLNEYRIEQCDIDDIDSKRIKLTK